jgi:hypothetical protein
MASNSEAATLSEVEGPRAKSRAVVCQGSMNRLAAALIAYVVIGILTWMTISDQRIRAVTLLILAMFAVKTWVRRKDVLHPDSDDE